MNKSEAIEVLKQFVNRLDTQENRVTAAPVQFLLQVERTIWGESLFHIDLVRFGLPNYDYFDYETENDLLNALKENGWSVEDIEKEKKNIVRYEGTNYWETQQCFLTEHGVERHISMNKHNLGKHRDYVIHAFRNPELQELYDAIREVIR